jgi:hypothetical protein
MPDGDDDGDTEAWLTTMVVTGIWREARKEGTRI